MAMIISAGAALWLLAATPEALVLQSAGGVPTQMPVTRSADYYRQPLHNVGDLQYSGDLVIGNQNITGIFDTGSFELVVFSTRCATCGIAGTFSPDKSATYKKGRQKNEQAYGSGSCDTLDGFDDVVVGPFKAKAQAFWEAYSCKMPLLKKASFNAIVGIGAPGQPEISARNGLHRVEQKIKALSEEGKEVSQDLRRAQQNMKARVRDAKSKAAMLTNYGVSTFSICLGREKGSTGWLIWNDVKPRGSLRIPVVGSIMWGIKMEDVKLRDERKNAKQKIHAIDCKDGCGAVVDSGTSLIGVPSAVYLKFAAALGFRLLNCRDLRKFPELVITLGGQEIALPPESYVGRMYGNAPAHVKKYLHQGDQEHQSDSADFGGGALGTVARALQNASEHMVDAQKDIEDMLAGAVKSSLPVCELLLMDLGDQQTQFGPMYILGMPFFREYYTTFDVGETREDRAIYINTADNKCQPAGDRGLAIARDVGNTGPRYRRRIEESAEPVEPRWVDVSKLRVPPWLEGDVTDL